MPYRDREQQRAYMRAWRATHPERLRCHRRAEVLQSAFQRGRLPSARVVERHGFTREELRPLVSRMLALRGLDVNRCDTPTTTNIPVVERLTQNLIPT